MRKLGLRHHFVHLTNRIFPGLKIQGSSAIHGENIPKLFDNLYKNRYFK